MNLFLSSDAPLSCLGFNIEDFMALSISSVKQPDPLSPPKEEKKATMPKDSIEKKSAGHPSIPPQNINPVKDDAISSRATVSRKHLHEDDEERAPKLSKMQGISKMASSRKHPHKDDTLVPRKRFKMDHSCGRKSKKNPHIEDTLRPRKRNKVKHASDTVISKKNPHEKGNIRIHKRVPVHFGFFKAAGAREHLRVVKETAAKKPHIHL